MKIQESQDQIIQKYILNQIQKSEHKQLIDQVAFIHRQVKQKYEISFENNISSKHFEIEKSLIIKLNKQRECSLLSTYNVSQKSNNSFISQNMYQFNEIINKKKMLGMTQGKVQSKLEKCFNNNNLMIQQFEMCHHCKQIFKACNLIKCNYNSKKMGLPIYNPKIYQFKSYKKKVRTDNRLKSDKDLICKRQFCIHCLKQNYTCQIQEITKNKQWICLFCQGICFCVTCLREDMILKLKNVYFQSGGNLQSLQQIPNLQQTLQSFLQTSNQNSTKLNHENDNHQQLLIKKIKWKRMYGNQFKKLKKMSKIFRKQINKVLQQKEKINKIKEFQKNLKLFKYKCKQQYLSILNLMRNKKKRKQIKKQINKRNKAIINRNEPNDEHK